MPQDELARRVESVRRFNRFYTQKIGFLRDRRFWGPYSLAEVRVLYELAHGNAPTAALLGKELGIDQGYLSRILSKFARRGFLRRSRSKEDGRASHLALTKQGFAVLAPVNARAVGEVASLLAPRSDAEQARLLAAMRTIEDVLGAPKNGAGDLLLRPPRAGDMGWVVHRHGALYALERRWDERFEAMVAGIVAEFAKARDPRRERCFIAEKDGENVGSVFLVSKSRTTAQLRLLLVEPAARGRGIGGRLVDECVRFARESGYRKVELWTDSGLHAARRLYERAGFRRTAEKKHAGFGHELVGQTWELKL